MPHYEYILVVQDETELLGGVLEASLTHLSKREELRLVHRQAEPPKHRSASTVGRAEFVRAVCIVRLLLA